MGAIVVLLFCTLSPARARADAPADQDIARAIARGVAFLKEVQADEGYWEEPSQG